MPKRGAGRGTCTSYEVARAPATAAQSAHLLPYSSMRWRAAATCCSTRAPTVAPSARSLAVTAPSTRAGEWDWTREVDAMLSGYGAAGPTQDPSQLNSNQFARTVDEASDLPIYPVWILLFRKGAAPYNTARCSPCLPLRACRSSSSSRPGPYL